MIVTQIRPRRRSCCSNLVLRRAPRPHAVKLRQHGRRSRPCWLPDAGNHPPVKTARKGTPHEKSSSPRESCFFRGLDWRGVSMLHRAAIPPVTHSAASCLASGDLLVLHLKIDIFCHLSIFFLTSAEKTSRGVDFIHDLTKRRLRCILRHKDAAINGRRSVTAPKGGDAMFFVLTIHVLGHSISIRVQKLKSRNRHPAR